MTIPLRGVDSTTKQDMSVRLTRIFQFENFNDAKGMPTAEKEMPMGRKEALVVRFLKIYHFSG